MDDIVRDRRRLRDLIKSWDKRAVVVSFEMRDDHTLDAIPPATIRTFNCQFAGTFTTFGSLGRVETGRTWRGAGAAAYFELAAVRWASPSLCWIGLGPEPHPRTLADMARYRAWREEAAAAEQPFYLGERGAAAQVAGEERRILAERGIRLLNAGAALAQAVRAVAVQEEQIQAALERYDEAMDELYGGWQF